MLVANLAAIRQTLPVARFCGVQIPQVMGNVSLVHEHTTELSHVAGLSRQCQAFSVERERSVRFMAFYRHHCQHVECARRYDEIPNLLCEERAAV
jgi:hypothetical protein